MPKDVFGYAKHHEKTNFGLSYILTLTRNKDNGVLDKTADFDDARLEIDHNHWYVSHYTPSIQQQGLSGNQTLSKTPTELRYIKRLVFLKEMNNHNLWNFELRS